MKKNLLLTIAFFFATTALFAQSRYFISLNDENKLLSVAFSFKENQEIKSPFAAGKVIKVGRKGAADDNGLGNHVIVEYDMSFTYEGKKVSQEPVVLIFANLKEVRVKKGDPVAEHQVLGMTWNDKDPDPGFRMFVLSETARNEFLLYKSDRCFKSGDVCYWDPSFLFR